MQGTFYSLKIEKPNLLADGETWLLKLLNEVIDYFKANSDLVVNPGDRIGMSLRNNTCGTEPVYISLRRADQLSASVIMDQIRRIFDSNKDFFLNGHLSVQFDHIQMPRGGGNPRITRKFGETNTDFILNKACFLKYQNPSKKNPGDEYCLPYALVISRAFNQSRNNEIGKRVYQNYLRSYKTLRTAAEELCSKAGVNISRLRGGCSFDEVKRFQSVLPNYQIVVFAPDSKKPIHVDSRYNGKQNLNIMLHKNHYRAMRSLPACFGAHYICPQCYSHTDRKQSHVCKYACTQCNGNPKCDTTSPLIPCSSCYRNFYGRECFSNHLKAMGKSNSVCSYKQNCPKCKCRNFEGHICGKRHCFTCEKVVDKENHQCYMPKSETKREEGMNILYVMYDFETQQDTQLSIDEPNKFKHIPNLCVEQSVCLKCIDEPDISIPCLYCGVREHIHLSKNCVENLMDFLVAKHNEKISKKGTDGKIKQVAKFDNIICIAHNMSGFDGQFILKYIYESDRFSKPSIIMNGTRIIEITLSSNIRFIDSLNYFQVGLAKLPQLFGFEGTKGFYPHLFNVPEFEKYKGPLPEKHYYSPESMMPNVKAAFDEWYDSQPANYEFNNEEELVAYCRQDVTILRKACVKFVKDFWANNKIDPFLDASTVPGACNKFFRSRFLEEDTIGIIPTNGYRLAENQSKMALRWLCSVEMENKIEIQHAGRGREINIPGVGRVDGVYGSTVFEFDGCYWHGCPSCYPAYSGDDETLGFISPEISTRRDATLTKHKNIVQAGYDLVIKRECDFKRELEENRELAAALDDHPMLVHEPLDPREAFFGGRTNANKMYFKSDGVTKMHYLDICSLYPFINKTAKCPIGHPSIYVGAECMMLPWETMDGLMKVTVKPPRKLAFPVLPTRMHSKLMFVLCKTCGQNLYQGVCEHSDLERQITGTYVIDEVKLAIEKGYEIVDIHEIWEYQITQYNPTTKTGGIFAGFINLFLKSKTEASGWPKSCQTREQQLAFIEEFDKREGVLLDESEIQFNPSLRSMSKIMLNSFWGRFGMRPDLLRTKLVNSGEELRDIILNPRYVVHSVLPINDDNLLINYREKEEARGPNKTTNVVIAAFTTSYARMELYKYLDFLGDERVYYFDTDSIIFTQRPGDEMPEIGDFLGQMTDELASYGPGTYIIEYVSGGPKNYAYKAYSPTKKEIFTVVKVKGITLNSEISKTMNFDLMKEMIVDLTVDRVILTNQSIRRTNTADVYTTKVKKTYKNNYTKRQKTGSNYSTVPYGY